LSAERRSEQAGSFQGDPQRDGAVCAGIEVHPAHAHIQAAIHTLSASPTLREHFKGDIEDLKRRWRQWESADVRVGLIGITSSGKSTLLNAMFSERLLPAGVPPSSNVLVVCRRGARQQAVFHYEDGHREEIVTEIAGRLAASVDERRNASNAQGLREVELYSPGFMLPEGISLVDTPGLNAYGLEHHEALTMNLFLPSVDMVVFTTAAKASSDLESKLRLDQIGQAGKPLFLVQTMIDSVEPKRGQGGRIERSRAEVKADHLLRLRRLLREGLTVLVREAPVFQVSALLARQGRLDESGLPELSQSIQQHLQALRPALEHGRQEQVRDILKKTLAQQRELADPRQSGDVLDREERSLDAVGRRLGAVLATLARQLQKIGREVSAAGESLVARARTIGKGDISKAYALNRDVKKWQQQLARSIDGALENARKLLDEQARALHLGPNDCYRALNRPEHQAGSLAVATTPHSTPRKVAKPGAWNAIKRFFDADSGYTTVNDVTTVVRPSENLRRVKALIRQELVWAHEASVQVQEHIETALARVQTQLKSNQRSLERKRAQILAAKERESVVREIGQILHRLDTEIAAYCPSAPPSPAGHADDDVALVEMQVPRYLPPLLMLGVKRQAARFFASRDLVLGRAEPKPDHVTIWGWDAEALSSFMVRFWGDMVAPGTIPVGQAFHLARLPYGGASLAVIDEPLLRRRMGEPGYQPAQLPTTQVLMLLADVVQPGCTMNQLAGSLVLDHILPETRLVLVLPSVRALEATGELGDGLLAARDIAAFLPYPLIGVLVNDTKLVYTFLADRLLREGQQLRTLADEQDWARSLSGTDRDKRMGTEVAEALRRWRAQGSPLPPAS